EKRSVEIEGDQALPFGKGQLVDPRAGIRNDRTPADGVDEDVNPAEFLLDRGDGRLDLPGIEGVAKPALGLATRLSQRRHRLHEAALVIVDADDDRTFTSHDLGSCAPDPVG